MTSRTFIAFAACAVGPLAGYIAFMALIYASGGWIAAFPALPALAPFLAALLPLAGFAAIGQLRRGLPVVAGSALAIGAFAYLIAETYRDAPFLLHTLIGANGNGQSPYVWPLVFFVALPLALSAEALAATLLLSKASQPAVAAQP